MLFRSGVNGTVGSSGTSGTSGTNGTSGVDGTTGLTSSEFYYNDNIDTLIVPNIVVGDHSTSGTTAQVINAVYGTSGTPPAASSVTIGTIYIQYIQ